MTENTQTQLESTTVFQMQTNADGPSFFDYLNPELPHIERFDPERLLALPRVQISRDVYWHMLEVLPPAFFQSGSFVMREATTDSRDHSHVISSKFRQIGESYWHRYVAIPCEAWAREVD